MWPPHLRVVLAALLLLPLASCTNDEATSNGGGGANPEAVSFEPIVMPHPKGVRRGVRNAQDKRFIEGDDAGWQEKFELAQRYVAGGYDEQALQILSGALAQKIPAYWAGKMRALKTSVQVRRAEEVLLRIDARGVKDYVTFGEPIDFVIRFRNVSAETVTLFAPAEGESETSPSALQLEISRRDRDIHATQLKRTWNQTVFLHEQGGEAIRIPAGGMHEVPVRIPASSAGTAIAGLRTIEVAGVLRPTRLRKGNEPRTVRLPIRMGRVMAMPRNFEPLTVDPLRSMTTAVDTTAPAHLLIATEFVPPERRAEAVSILARALGEGHPALYRAALGGLSLLRERAVGRPLAPLARPLISWLGRTKRRGEALMEGLSTLTGVRLASDPRLWQDWWRRESTQKMAVTAAGTSGR